MKMRLAQALAIVAIIAMAIVGFLLVQEDQGEVQGTEDGETGTPDLGTVIWDQVLDYKVQGAGLTHAKAYYAGNWGLNFDETEISSGRVISPSCNEVFFVIIADEGWKSSATVSTSPRVNNTETQQEDRVYNTEPGDTSKIIPEEYTSKYYCTIVVVDLAESGYWGRGECSNNRFYNTTITVSVEKAIEYIDKPTAVSGGGQYKGSSYTATINGYDSNTMTLDSGGSGTDAGIYTVKVTPRSGYAWSDTKVASQYEVGSWKITPADLTLSGSKDISDSWTYDAASRTETFSVTASKDNAEVSIAFTKQGSTTYDLSASSGKTATFSKAFTDVSDSGSWTWVASAGNNYNTMPGSVNITISQKTMSASDFTQNPVSCSYDGTAKSGAYTLKNTNLDGKFTYTMTYGASGNADHTNVTSSPIDVYITVAKNTNFTAAGPIKVGTLSIGKVNPIAQYFQLSFPTGYSVTQAASGNNYQYTASIAYDSTQRGASSVGYRSPITNPSVTPVVHYYIGDTEYAEPKLGGTYQIYVTITGDGKNLNASSGKGVQVGTMTITKITPTAEWISKSVIDVTDAQGGGEETWDGADKYIKGQMNQKKWEIDYNGYPSKVANTKWLTSSGEESGVTNPIVIRYYSETDGKWFTGTTYPTDAGTYRIYADVQAGNSFDVTDGLQVGTIVISPIDPTPEHIVLPNHDDGDERGQSKVYNAKQQGIEVAWGEPFTNNTGTGAQTGITLDYYLNGVKQDGEPRNVNDYVVKANVQAGRNFKTGADLEIGMFHITKADLTFDANASFLKKTWTYDLDDRTFKITMKSCDAEDATSITIQLSSEENTFGINQYEIAKQTSVPQDGRYANSFTFQQTFKYVQDSGVWSWIAYTDDGNYNTYTATQDQWITVEIQKKTAEPYDFVLKWNGEDQEKVADEKHYTYSGYGWPASVQWKDNPDLVGTDGRPNYAQKPADITLVYVKDGKDYTEPVDVGTYQVYAVFGDDPNYVQPSSNDGRVPLGTVVIEKKDLNVPTDLRIDGTDNGSWQATDPTYSYDGNRHGPEVKWTEPLTGSEADPEGGYQVVYFYENGNPVNGVPTEAGTYNVYVKIGEDNQNFNPVNPYDENGRDAHNQQAYIGKMTIDKGPVKIVDFRYDLVKDGQTMTMNIITDPAGRLVSDMVIKVGGKEIVLKDCRYEYDDDGRAIAVVQYETNRGDIPPGVFTEIEITYPGDSNHYPSEPYVTKVHTRSNNLPVIPEEGGEVPIDPDKGSTEVETPIGDIIVELDEDGDGERDEDDRTYSDDWSDGSDDGTQDGTDAGKGDRENPTVYIRGYEAGEDEEVPGADKTVVIRTDVDPDEMPYWVIPTVWVDVPGGKKPVVKLYDQDGEYVSTPEVLGYTTDSVTFITYEEDCAYLRAGITFVNTFMPFPDDDSEESDAAGAIGSLVFDEKDSGLSEGTEKLVAGSIAAVIAGIIATIAATQRRRA